MPSAISSRITVSFVLRRTCGALPQRVELDLFDLLSQLQTDGLQLATQLFVLAVQLLEVFVATLVADVLSLVVG